MAEIISSNKTIAKNTLFLYARMLFNLVVSLYTSRVILQVLGVEDLGVYQVVAGVVVLFGFLNSSLAGATSRFLAYELGNGDPERLRKTFSATLNVHILLAVLVFVVAQTVGLWLVCNYLVIPQPRMDAAIWVYEFSIFSLMLEIIQVPYNSTIIAHEKMNVFAYVGILDTILKLVACFVVYFVFFDKFITYGFLIFFFALLIQSIYYFYCKHHFKECKFSFQREWSLMKPILVFSSWDVFASLSFTLKNQGINIFLNVFFGVIVNAACGFANTVYGAISGFAKNFSMSVRPAITKSFSSKDFNRFEELIISSGKFSFSLMLLLSAPFFFCADYILRLWLVTPPPYTAEFCKLQLLSCVISVLFSSVIFGIMATGKNKKYSLFEGCVMLFVLLIAYMLFKLGTSPVAPFIFMVLVELVKSNYYVRLLHNELKAFNWRRFYKEAVIPCFLMFALVMGGCFCCMELMPANNLLRFISVSTLSTVLVLISSLFIVCTKKERKKIIGTIRSKVV